MAADATSTFFDSKVSVFKLNDVSTAQDISANIVNLDFTNAFKINDVTTYGSTGVKSALSIDESKFSMDLIFNQVTTTGSQTVVGAMWYAKATRAFEYYPVGTTSGNLKISGNCQCTNYQITGKVGDSIRVKADFVVNNGVTFGTAS